MRLGVFLCTCDKTSNINLKAIKKSIEDAEIVEVHDRFCQEEGLSYIVDDIRRKKLDTFLIGCTQKKSIFQKILDEWELERESVSFLNLREHCSWVHDKKEATKKAKSMIRATVNRIKNRPTPRILGKNTGLDILIVGSSTGAVEIARNLSKLGEVQLLLDGLIGEKAPSLEGLSPIFGSVRDVKGNIGGFSIEYLPDPINQDKCILCGRCLDFCPRGAVQFNSRYFVTSACDKCGDCISICPTGAVDLARKPANTSAGHIVVIDYDWTYTTKRGIYIIDSNDIASLPSLIDAISNLSEIRVQKYLDLHLENCASGKSGIEGCRLCEDNCPYDAIHREGNRVVFDEFSCTGCGVCASMCPTSLPKMQDLSNEVFLSQMELLLKNNLAPKVLMFICGDGGVATLDAAGRKHLRYPPAIPLFVPSLGAVSEAHLLRAFDLGADGVLMLGCEKCLSIIQKTHSFEFADLALKAFDLGGRIKVIGVSQDPEAFVRILSDFVRELKPSPLRGKMPSTLEKTDKRSIVLATLSSFSQKIKAPSLVREEPSFPFAMLSINSNCTLCNTCSNMCPADAVRKRDDRIDFVYSRCIACGLCHSSCPEKAIEMRKILDFKKLLNFEGETLFKSELVRCRECGKAFASKKAIERILAMVGDVRLDEFGIENQPELLNYCEECRSAQALKMMMERNL